MVVRCLYIEARFSNALLRSFTHYNSLVLVVGEYRKTSPNIRKDPKCALLPVSHDRSDHDLCSIALFLTYGLIRRASHFCPRLSVRSN